MKGRNNMEILGKRRFVRATLTLFTALMLGAIGTSSLSAAPKGSRVNVVPTIDAIRVGNGQLVAVGTVSATRNCKTTTQPFAAPVTLQIGTNQPGAACPVLNLALGPINLDLLGLVVETSPICLD